MNDYPRLVPSRQRRGQDRAEFASKASGPYTQLWVTHVDSEGNDAPPVLLDRFSAFGQRSCGVASYPFRQSEGCCAIAAQAARVFLPIHLPRGLALKRARGCMRGLCSRSA